MRYHQPTFTVLCISIGVFMFSGCARLQPPVTVQPQAGASTIVVKASDYKFEPNNIKVRQGEPVVFVVENLSDKKHNFSVKDPSGKSVVSVDLPPKSTERTKVTFVSPGAYELYCDEPFHSTLGMKGKITAE
ncbi:MAG TPA: cupredoxin domain-containing protein [Dissulfurispiraceae bacterium]